MGGNVNQRIVQRSFRLLYLSMANFRRRNKGNPAELEALKEVVWEAEVGFMVARRMANILCIWGKAQRLVVFHWCPFCEMSVKLGECVFAL